MIHYAKSVKAGLRNLYSYPFNCIGYSKTKEWELMCITSIFHSELSQKKEKCAPKKKNQKPFYFFIEPVGENS